MAKAKTEVAEKKQKTKCPLTKEEFLAAAKPLTIKIGEHLMSAGPRSFDSGSIGYYAGQKLTIMIGDVPVDFQVGVNITAIGSKPD